MSVRLGSDFHLEFLHTHKWVRLNIFDQITNGLVRTAALGFAWSWERCDEHRRFP